MLLVVDVGNTNVTLGVYEGKTLRVNWRLSTNKDSSADEIGMLLLGLMEHDNISPLQIEDVIISSVVPPVMYSLNHAMRKYLNKTPMVVDSSVKSNLTIRYDNPKEVGADRIVNAIGAIAEYKTPMVIVDFGTATTFCVINDKNEYLGGAILPGIKISMSALFERTAKLPRIEIAKPTHAIGTNTVDSMQAGVYYGYVGGVDYTVSKIKEELGRDDVTVIATGGLARMIAEDSKTIQHIDTKLTLKGLYTIYQQNRGEGPCTAK